MNRMLKLSASVCLLAALLMLVGCSLLEPILTPGKEVEAKPDEIDTRFVDGKPYRSPGTESHATGSAAATAPAETVDIDRELTEQERRDLMELYNEIVQPSGKVLIGGWGTPGIALMEKNPEAFDKAFDALRDAGINCVVTSDEWKSPEALAASLSAARNRDMTLWYNCAGQSGAYSVGKLTELLKLKNSDALDATVITATGRADGLTAADNTDFLQYIDELRARLGSDKLKMTVRLLPSYSDFSGNEPLNMSYTEYVQLYMRGHGMNYAVFDYDAYSTDDTDRIPGLLFSLQTARLFGCPVYPILQCAGGGRLREPTLEEFRLSVHLTLASGAAGYFLDGVCGNEDTHAVGILTPDGERTPMYNKVRAVNEELSGLRELFRNYSFRRLTVLNYEAAETLLGSTASLYFGRLVQATEVNDRPTVIGCFEDAQERNAYYVVNADTESNASVELTLRERSLVLVWGSNGCEYVNRDERITIGLKPGEGKLVTVYPLTQ